MPSVKSSSRPKVLDSSTVMTPSLPTLSIASAMSSPTCVSCADSAATAAMSDLLLDRAGGREELLGHGLDRGVDALLQGGRGGAGGDVAQALADQRLGQHGGGGGAVTRDVVGLGRHLLHQLGAEVLVRVVELDLAGDGDTVVGDGGGAELLVDDDVAALGADRHLDRVGKLVDAALEGATGVLVELQDLRHGSGSALSENVGETNCAPGARLRESRGPGAQFTAMLVSK